jgi:ferritin-like metal-binding protein YciE
MTDATSHSTRPSTPLARYRLGRAALDLRAFTVSELIALTRIPENTVYSFLADLGRQRVTSETLASATPGRPRKLYTLTDKGVEHLAAQNLEVAAVLRAEGFGAPAPRHEAAARSVPRAVVTAPVPAGIAAKVGPAAPVPAMPAEPAPIVSPAPEPAPNRGGMSPDSLRKLYVEDLKDLYSAEKQILQALPKMMKKASDDRLKRAFEEHLRVTEKQVERLDRIFESLGKSPRGKKCKGMEGLLEEGKEVMQEDMEPEILDAALIGAAQKVKHYEMAAYGTVRTYAELLGDNQSAKLLQQALDEEGDADKKLTRLAVSTVAAEVSYYSNSS